jgi:hypothetical protein
MNARGELTSRLGLIGAVLALPIGAMQAGGATGDGRVDESAVAQREKAPGEDFTIIVLPDTQFYSRDFPKIFAAQTAWIADSVSAYDIAFVTHVGDVVQDGSRDESQWQVADAALSALEDPETTRRAEGIPFGIAIGNHDRSPTTQMYNQYFGIDRFQGRAYYGGHRGTDNDDHFELFSAGGSDFVIVHLEFRDGPNAWQNWWADGVLKTHRDRWAIVVSHYIVETSQGAEFSEQGGAIYDRLRATPNLFLMLCGHKCEEVRRVDSFGERTVHTLLSCYQCRENGGNGWLRLMHFSPTDATIHVETYSPTLDLFETDGSSAFTIPFDPTGGPCVGDLQGDGHVDADDLLALFATWGPCPTPPAACPSDIGGDGTVGEADFIEVLERWGPCP